MARPQFMFAAKYVRFSLAIFYIFCTTGFCVRHDLEVASQGFPRFGFGLQHFRREDVAKNMVFATCDGRNAIGQQVPALWGGLWWMDGNPAPETVASFGHAEWIPGVQACKDVKLSHYEEEEKSAGIIKDPHGNTEPCQGRMIVAFWEDRMWAMPDTLVGRAYEAAGTVGDSHMEFVCGGPSQTNLTICKVGAFPGPEKAPESKIEQWRRKLLELGADAFNSLAAFSMVRVNEDYWIRYSLGDKFPYHLKRISDCNGKPVERHWRQFLSNGTERPYVEKDIYGNGGDDREHVAKVPENLFTRISKEGSCRKETGDHCSGKMCAPERQAVCDVSSCVCGPGTCAQDGKCGGNETWANHRWWLEKGSAHARLQPFSWLAATSCTLLLLFH